jgi:hypothetical protein
MELSATGSASENAEDMRHYKSYRSGIKHVCSSGYNTLYLGMQAGSNTLDEHAASIFWSILYDTLVSILCISYCNKNNYLSTTQ